MRTRDLNHFDENIDSLITRHDSTDCGGEVFAFYRRIEVVLSKTLSCSAHNTDSWCNIPYSNGCFIRLIKQVLSKIKKKKDKPIKFLDVGCGFGLKCWLAHILGLEATGIDLCKEYVELARKIFWYSYRDEFILKIQQANALKYKGYGDYDIVYMYHPIRNNDLMQKVVDRVTQQMKPGAFLVAILYGPQPQKGCFKYLGGGIYQRNKTRFDFSKKSGKIV